MYQTRKIGLYTALAVVIANMVGTGVFTSLGFQVAEIQSVFVLMLLWLLGGILAFCGAVCYAELGGLFPRSGGEYNFLSQVFHPGLGFVAGWVSATVGFAAPVALAAITFGKYLHSVYPVIPTDGAAILLLALVTWVHATSLRNSGAFQRGFTSLKVLLILVFVLATWLLTPSPQSLSLWPQESDGALILGAPFAVALIYVSYAYTGWNAATYLISEMEAPNRNLPLALAGGTLVVTLLYLLLNYVFLYAAPMDQLANKVEVGYVAANFAFGNGGAKLMGIILALLLISTVSAMVFAGPRVMQVMGQDIPMFAPLARTNQDGVPVVAILSQSFISLLFILSATFDKILLFAGFVLGVMTFFTVSAVLVHRWKHPAAPRPYRAWGYPFTPILFLLLMGWTLTYLLIDKPWESLTGLVLAILGAILYLMGRRRY